MAAKLIIHGAAGRMGRRILALAAEMEDFQLVGAVDHPKHPDLGKDAGILAGSGNLDLPLGAKLPDNGDVMIDFSLPEAAECTINHCAKHSIALVIGTTGLSEPHLEMLKAAAEKIPIVQAHNMSLGMNLLFSIVGQVAKSLGVDYDIEIVEAHHRFKKDSPSGSALSLAKAICEDTGRKYPDDLVHGREGKDALRQKGTIGMHAIRGGDIVGQHSVIYSTLGETVKVSHEAHSRDTFVTGALCATKWILQKPAGLYSMRDVLGLK